MPDYGNRCFRGCGRVAVVIEGDSRYCARCWHYMDMAREWAIGWRGLKALVGF